MCAGGSGRVMGSTRGPLLELLAAHRSGAFSLVGSAGSSFSELIASVIENDDPALIRTPFVKGSMVRTNFPLLNCHP